MTRFSELDIEATELMWKNDRYAKNVDRIFEKFSNEKNDSSIDDQRPDSWPNNGVSDPTPAQIWCFLDGLDLIWWLNRIISVTLCQSNEADLNQRSRKILLFVNRDYRVDPSVLSAL